MMRLDLACGHWELGEHDLALLCLERAVGEAPDALELRRVIAAWTPKSPPAVRRQLLELELRLVPVEGGGPTPAIYDICELQLDDESRPGAEQPDAAASREFTPQAAPDAEAGGLPPLATSTVAELLADQGNFEQAVHVADDVLRRNPSDARAQAVRNLVESKAHPQADAIAALESWLRTIEQRQSRSRAQEV